MKWILPLGAFGAFLAVLAAKKRHALARDNCPSLRGKALFIRSTRALGSGEIGVRRYLAKGYKWALIPWLWGRDGRKPNRDGAFYSALVRLNVPFLLMVWPTPREWRSQIAETTHAAKTHGALGIVLDVEKSSEWPTDQAREMAKYANEQAHSQGLKVGLTSWGSPQIHRSFPFDAFVPFMDFAIPQLYDPSLNLSESYFKEGFDSWISHGFRCLILGLSAFERTSGSPARKSYQAMDLYLGGAKTALRPTTAVLWGNIDPNNPQFQAWHI